MRPYFGGKSPTPLPYRPLPHVEEYLENLRVDEKSETYIRAAKIGLTHFSIFAEKEGIKHPDEIERFHLLRFQAHLASLQSEAGKPLALSYRQQLMRYVHTWINWLLDVEYITTNPWVRVKIGSIKKKPKPLEDEEIAALFDAHRRQAFSISPFYYHRREVILVLLYGWGLRLHELQSLTVAGMDLRQDFISARNKGGGTKTLPYGQEMKDVVQRYLIHRAKYAIPEVDALLIDSTGKQISTSMLYRTVTNLGTRAGVAINPHRLRDSFGTKMLDQDVPIERIMKMMGHTQREQTLAYSRLNDPKLKESHDAVMGPLIHNLLEGDRR